MTNEELVQLIKQGIDSPENMGLLYMQNKGMIYAVVKKYRYACQSDYNGTPIIELDELMHEAYFGLVKAIESYDASQGVLFMSYAIYWIRQAVKRYLDDSGKVIRVPVHTQEKIYRYNQITAHFLQHFNREPSLHEYAYYLRESPKAVEQLQRFMFRNKVKSLEAPVPGGEGEHISLADTINSDMDLEEEVLERVSKEQLQRELWDIVGIVLKDNRMTSVLRYRFVELLSLRETGERMGITIEAVRQLEYKALRRLRSNSKTKQLIKYLVV